MRTGPSAAVTVEIVRIDPVTKEGTIVATLPGTIEPSSGRWSVQIPPNAPYIVDGTYEVRVTGHSGPLVINQRSRFNVDLTSPAVTYGLPPSLTVGRAIRVPPQTSDSDIWWYGLPTGSRLPAGLVLDPVKGAIAGTPRAVSEPRSATIVVVDRAGNTSEVELQFPAVKQPQVLEGFVFAEASSTLGDPVPVLTAPRGALGALSYRSDTPSVCSAEPASGAIELLTDGTCTISVSAAATATHNPATAQASIVVHAAVQPPPVRPPTCTLTVKPFPREAADPITTTHSCGETVRPVHPPAKACWDSLGSLPAITLPGTAGTTSVTASYRRKPTEYVVKAVPGLGGKARAVVSVVCGRDEIGATELDGCDAEVAGSLLATFLAADKLFLASLGDGGSIRIPVPACGSERQRP